MKSKTQKKRRAPRASSTAAVRPLPWTGTASTAQLRVARASALAAQKTKSGRVAPPGLTGYLVIWRHTMDDVPVGLFRTKEAAMEAANKTSFRAGYAAAKKLDIDCRTPVCFAVIGFDNGKPTEMFVVDRPDDA